MGDGKIMLFKEYQPIKKIWSSSYFQQEDNIIYDDYIIYQLKLL